MSTWQNVWSTPDAMFRTELWKLRVDDKTFVFASEHKPFGDRPEIWDMQVVFSHPTNPNGLPNVFIVDGDHREPILNLNREELKQWCKNKQTKP